MAVTYDRITLDGDTESNTVTFDLASATPDGRLSLLVIGPDGSQAFTGLDGFTSRLAQSVGSAGDYLLVASKDASSEATQYSLTRTGGTENWAGALLEFSGADNTDPILTESSVNTGTMDAVGPVNGVSPAITAQSSDSKIVRIWTVGSVSSAEWSNIDGGSSSSTSADADEVGRVREGSDGIIVYVSDSPGAGVSTGTEELGMTYQSTGYAAVTLEIGPATAASSTVGDIGHWRDSAGSQIPGTTFAGFNFAGQERLDNSTYTKPNDSTIQFTDAGDYLLTWHLKGSDTSNGRHAPQSRAAVTTGSGAFFTTYYSGFNRNTANSTFGTDGFAFYRAAASDQVQIQWKRDTDTPTGGTDINESDLQVVRLGDSYNYGIYNSTDDNQSYGGTTPTDINFQTTILESNTAQIEKVSDTDIRLKGDAAKRYLICYGVSGDTAGSRTQRVSRVLAGTSEIEASRSYFYSRNSSNEFVGLGAPFLWKKAGTTDDISVQMWRGDGVLADEGGADTDGTFDSINGEQTALFICELPDHVDVFASHDSVGGQDIAGGVTTSINAVRDVAFNDSDSFTKASDTEINVVQASDVLVFGNIWTARATVSSGTRLTLGARFTIDGVDQTTGTSITYTRGNQGTQDTFAGSWHPSAVYSVSAGADLLLETFDDGDNGGDDTTQANTVGLFAINLYSLEASGATATLAVAEAADTLTASGAVTAPGVTGSLSEVESVDSLSASGANEIGSALSEVESVDALSASGANAVGSSLSEVESADALSASGANEIGSALSEVESADALSASGSNAVGSSLSEVESVDALSASGANEIGSALSEVESVDQLTASAFSSLSAELSETNESDSLSAIGAVTLGITGSLSETQTDNTLSASASLSITSSLSEPENADVLAASATNSISSALAEVQADDTADVEGEVANPVSGALSRLELADQLTASGVVALPVAGSLSVTEIADLLTANGLIQTTGISQNELAIVDDRQALSLSATTDSLSLLVTLDDPSLSTTSDSLSISTTNQDLNISNG